MTRARPRGSTHNVEPEVALYTGVLLVVTAVAVAVGGAIAQRLSLAYLAAQLVSVAGSGTRFAHPTLTYVLPDLGLFVAVLWISCRSPQFWPMICAALQLVTVLGHLARLRDPDVLPLAYAIMIQWTAWPAAATLMAGILADRRAGRTS